MRRNGPGTAKPPTVTRHRLSFGDTRTTWTPTPPLDNSSVWRRSPGHSACTPWEPIRNLARSQRLLEPPRPQIRLPTHILPRPSDSIPACSLTTHFPPLLKRHFVHLLKRCNKNGNCPLLNSRFRYYCAAGAVFRDHVRVRRAKSYIRRHKHGRKLHSAVLGYAVFFFNHETLTE